MSGLLQGFQAFLCRPQRAHRSTGSAAQRCISMLAARLPDSSSLILSAPMTPRVSFLSIPITQAYTSILTGRRVRFDSFAVCTGTLKQEVHKGRQRQRSRWPAPDSYDDCMRQIPDVTSFLMPHPDRIQGLLVQGHNSILVYGNKEWE